MTSQNRRRSFSRRLLNNKMSSAEKSLIKHAETYKGVESLEKEDTEFQKDTKYSWFVCSCAFITQVFVLGVLHAFGVFYVEFIKDFKSSKGETAWIGSLAYGLSMTFGPITSILVGRFGNNRVMSTGGVICATSLVLSSFCKTTSMMFLNFSLLYGIGTCMCTSPTMTITPLFFDKYLSVATGITVSGSSFGTLIMGPLSQAIIDYAGWRTAFRVYAGFCLLTSVLNTRIRTLPQMKRRRGEGHSFIRDLQIWKNRVFVVWTISITLVMFGFYIPYVHLVSFAIDQGVSSDLASILMMIMGATTALGRIMFGKIVQYGVLHRLHMHQLSMLVTGTGVMILPLLNTYPLIVIYVIIAGLVDGCYVVLLPILTASLMGIENSVLAWGFMIGSCSITFTLGPPAAGALYDMTGSYNVAFHCAGLPILAGSAMLFLIPWAQRTARSRNVLKSIVTESTCITVMPESSQGSGVRRTDSVGTVCENDVIEPTLVVQTRSTVTMRTTGTSTASSFVDKATCTDDIFLRMPQYSMDVEDALSQLSYNSEVFEEMLRRSLDQQYVSMATSTTSQEVPRIPPPTEPLRYRRREDRSDGYRNSSLSSQLSQNSENSHHQQHSISGTPGSAFSNYSHHRILQQAALSLLSPNSGEQLPSISQLFQMRAQPVSRSSSLEDASENVPNIPAPMQPDVVPSVRSPLEAPGKPIPPPSEQTFTSKMRSPVNDLESTGLTLPVPTRSEDEEAKIGDNLGRLAMAKGTESATAGQVPIRRERFITPANSPEKESECFFPQRHGSVSPAIDILRPPPLVEPDVRPRTECPFSEQEVAESIHSGSFLARKIEEIEASRRENDVRDDEPSTSAQVFIEDNQLTVVAAKKETPPTGNRLQDLFKPISEEITKKSSSFEIIGEGSEHDVIKTGSRTGEIDVFTHLFDDEETNS